jgi:hypothetical protein
VTPAVISTYLPCYTGDTFCKPLFIKVVLHWSTGIDIARAAARTAQRRIIGPAIVQRHARYLARHVLF